MFSDSSSLCRIFVIFDLGECETFSADYMAVVDFFLVILEADFGVRIIRGCVLYVGNYGT